MLRRDFSESLTARTFEPRPDQAEEKH